MKSMPEWLLPVEISFPANQTGMRSFPEGTATAAVAVWLVHATTVWFSRLSDSP
jgi:hypothetical protein